jgi:hypothetical protein
MNLFLHRSDNMIKGFSRKKNATGRNTTDPASIVMGQPGSAATHAGGGEEGSGPPIARPLARSRRARSCSFLYGPAQ